jgi:Zn-dependent metalloprotease
MTDDLPPDLQARKQEAEVRKLEAEAAKAAADAETASANADKAKADAEKAAADTKASIALGDANAAKAQADAAKAQADATKANADAQLSAAQARGAEAKTSTDARVAEAAARKAEAEVEEYDSATSVQQRQATSAKSIAEAEKDASAARRAQIGALIPDLSTVKPSTLEVKDGPPIGGSILTFGALRPVGATIAKAILAAPQGDKPWRVLITSDTDLATSDGTYVDVKTGLAELDEAAGLLIEDLKPDAPGIAPVLLDIVAALATALPGLLSMLSAQRSLSTAPVTVNDLAAVAAVSGGLLLKKDTRDISLYHDDFRLVPEGGVYAASAQVSTKRQDLMGRKIVLSKRKEDFGAEVEAALSTKKELEKQIDEAGDAVPPKLVEDLAAVVKKIKDLNRKIADETVRLGMIGSLASTIDQFLSAIRLIPEGAHRSPLATSALRELLHENAGGKKAFTHALLVKGQAGQSQQLLENRPLWFQDKFSTVVDVSVTFTLIELPESNVVSAGTVTGTAKAYGKIGDEPKVALAEPANGTYERTRSMAGNGMTTFSVHADEGEGLQAFERAGAVTGDAGGSGPAVIINAILGPTLGLRGLTFDRPGPGDPETAAREYLDRAFASEDVPLVTAEPIGDAEPEFRSLGVEEVRLTRTQTVKFRQQYEGVPVYGSLVTVEMGYANEFISLSTAIGNPSGVSPKPELTPDDAIDIAQGEENADDPTSDSLDVELYFYFDARGERWHLAYIIRDCPTILQPGAGRELADVVVDAHDGSIIAYLPRLQSMTSEDAPDALGALRTIEFTSGPGGKILADQTLGVETYDFAFRDARREKALLPGQSINNPPSWDPAAVSAHANAIMVATFVRDVLLRNGLDGKGSKYQSSIRCTFNGSGKEWANAAWYSNQMIFGQRKVAGSLLSYAVSADIVAHEMTHGLTAATAGLDSTGMPGALNESYSDIFAVIISNAATPSLAAWNWEIGEALKGTGLPLRDLRDPTKYGQPDHMDDYDYSMSLDPYGDWGGVHHNSGIHNRAGYGVITAKDSLGNDIFAPAQVAALFYLALSQHLTTTSTFGRSRRAVKLAALTLLRADLLQQDKLRAIDEAFDAVGIDEEP